MKGTQLPAVCETCPANPEKWLVPRGLQQAGHDYLVALAGNPNVGKSTVFNNLTGLRQHTGNWPGKTVARAEGAFSYNGKKFRIVDLPGTYSLLSASTDEEIARDFILFGMPDVTVVVVDATMLERNLNLVLQVLGITDKVVVCLNLIDEAKRRGLVVDDRTLARDLGVPVVPAAARQGVGIPELVRAVHDVAAGVAVCRPRRVWTEAPRLRSAVDDIARRIQKEFPDVPNARWVALRLLEGDQRMMDAVRSGELARLARKEPLMEEKTRKGEADGG
jgi:ferrous iron transport protein B